MRTIDRLARLEARGDGTARHQQVEADAAEFDIRMARLVEREADEPRTTPAEFRTAIRQSGSPFLIATFLGDETHAD